MSVEVIAAAVLAGVPHGFLGRRGGVSTGICAGLNVGLGSSDDREAIRENRRRAIDAVQPGAELVTLHQIHSGIAVHVFGAYRTTSAPTPTRWSRTGRGCCSGS
jgi:copper oxidase (laccase) domain-containing protein